MVWDSVHSRSLEMYFSLLFFSPQFASSLHLIFIFLAFALVFHYHLLSCCWSCSVLCFFLVWAHLWLIVVHIFFLSRWIRFRYKSAASSCLFSVRFAWISFIIEKRIQHTEFSNSKVMLIFFLSADGNDRIRLYGEKNKIFRVHTKNGFSVFTRSQNKKKNAQMKWTKTTTKKTNNEEKNFLFCSTNSKHLLLLLFSFVYRILFFVLPWFLFLRIVCIQIWREFNIYIRYLWTEYEMHICCKAFFFLPFYSPTKHLVFSYQFWGLCCAQRAKNTETKAKKYEKKKKKEKGKIIAFVRYVCWAEAWLFLSPILLHANRLPFLAESNVSKKKMSMQLNIKIRVRAFRQFWLFSAHTKITE